MNRKYFIKEQFKDMEMIWILKFCEHYLLNSITSRRVQFAVCHSIWVCVTYYVQTYILKPCAI